MPPIRVALIGLGPISSPHYKPGEWGIQHMNAIVSSPHYELVAVCNSTVESAKRSIESHKLPSTVKAYGSPEDVGRDPDVDLVAVTVNLDRHYELVKPLLKQKKDIIVEFPFMSSIAQTDELLALAKAGQVKNFVASQGRADPAIRKLKKLVQSKAIGEILYTSFTAQNLFGTPDVWPKSLQKFLDVETGISRVNVVLGHRFRSVQSVFKQGRGTTKLVDGQGDVVDANFKDTSPEHMLLQGVLHNGAIATFSIRSTAVIAESSAYRWILTGTEGEIVFTCGPGTFQMSPPEAKIYLKKGGADVKEVSFEMEESSHITTAGQMGINVARVYEAVAHDETDALSTIEQSLEIEKLLVELKKVAVWAH